MVGSEAEDVVQEVFVKLLSASATDDTLVAWLYTTSTNLCLDRLRHLARRHDGWKNELKDTLTRKTGPVDQLLADKDLCRKLLATVDERLQEVAILVHLDEMTHQEAADLLEVPLGTVLSRVSRARQRLREYWLHVAKSTAG